MLDKPVTVIIYLLSGLILAFLPIVLELRGRSALNGPPFRGSAAWWFLGAAVGTLLGLTLPWWRSAADLFTLPELLSYALILGICLVCFFVESNAEESSKIKPGISAAVASLCCIVAGVLCFTTGLLDEPLMKFTAWHHWGAYIAPAEMLRSGARVFYDFPAQYGFGPTSLIAAGCGQECWVGFYYVSGAASWLLVLLGLVLIVVLQFRSLGALCVGLIASAVAGLFWVTYPPAASTPLTVPSVAGLRFLPALAIVAVIFWIETSKYLRQLWILIGFTVFAIGVLWSPEAMFMSLVVWGPYYTLRRLSDQGTRSARLRALWLSLLHLAGALVLIWGGFVLIYWGIFGVRPQIGSYLAYMIRPPGALPINFTGPVWFSIVAIMLSAWTNLKLYGHDGNSGEFRGRFAITMIAYASLSYAMGRSHDNNFLNVLPYSVLALANVLTARPARVAGGISSAMLASVVALLVLFGWNSWAHSLSQGTAFSFRPRDFVASLSYSDSETVADAAVALGPAAIDFASASRALKYVHSVSNDPAVIIDPGYFNLPNAGVWSSLHGPANFFYLPSEYRTRMLQDGAQRLARPGWLIISKSLISTWLPEFDVAYNRTEDIDFESYRAIRFTPRVQE